MDSNTYIDEINLLNNIHDKGINYLITIFNQPNIIHTDINKDQLLFNYYNLRLLKSDWLNFRGFSDYNYFLKIFLQNG